MMAFALAHLMNRDNVGMLQMRGHFRLDPKPADGLR